MRLKQKTLESPHWKCWRCATVEQHLWHAKHWSTYWKQTYAEVYRNLLAESLSEMIPSFNSPDFVYGVFQLKNWMAIPNWLPSLTPVPAPGATNPLIIPAAPAPTAKVIIPPDRREDDILLKTAMISRSPKRRTDPMFFWIESLERAAEDFKAHNSEKKMQGVRRPVNDFRESWKSMVIRLWFQIPVASKPRISHDGDVSWADAGTCAWRCSLQRDRLHKQLVSCKTMWQTSTVGRCEVWFLANDLKCYLCFFFKWFF